METIDISKIKIKINYSEEPFLEITKNKKLQYLCSGFAILVGLFASLQIGIYYGTSIIVLIIGNSIQTIPLNQVIFLAYIGSIITLYFLFKLIMKLVIQFNMELKTRPIKELADEYISKNAFKISFIASFLFMIYGTWIGILEWRNNSHDIQKAISEKFIISNILQYNNPLKSYTVKLIFIVMVFLALYLLLLYYFPKIKEYHEKEKTMIEKFNIEIMEISEEHSQLSKILRKKDENRKKIKIFKSIPINFDIIAYNRESNDGYIGFWILFFNQIILFFGIIIIKAFEPFQTQNILENIPNLIVGTIFLVVLINWTDRMMTGENKILILKNEILDYLNEKIEEKALNEHQTDSDLLYFIYLKNRLDNFRIKTLIDKENLLKIIQLIIPVLFIKIIVLYI